MTFKLIKVYIPDSNFNFKLNIDNMSYKPTHELSYNYSVLNKMKNFVYDGLEKKNKKLEKKIIMKKKVKKKKMKKIHV